MSTKTLDINTNAIPTVAEGLKRILASSAVLISIIFCSVYYQNDGLIWQLCYL